MRILTTGDVLIDGSTDLVGSDAADASSIETRRLQPLETATRGQMEIGLFGSFGASTADRLGGANGSYVASARFACAHHVRPLLAGSRHTDFDRLGPFVASCSPPRPAIE